jgi:hypothetical protein
MATLPARVVEESNAAATIVRVQQLDWPNGLVTVGFVVEFVDKTTVRADSLYQAREYREKRLALWRQALAMVPE